MANGEKILKVRTVVSTVGPKVLTRTVPTSVRSRYLYLPTYLNVQRASGPLPAQIKIKPYSCTSTVHNLSTVQ